jgi:hypothetical protein
MSLSLDRNAAGIAVRYTIFAAIASGINIACQKIAAWLYTGPLALFVAMAAGTGAALVVKYILDKHWIFNDASTGAAVHLRKFSLYTLMGLGTTALFWATEWFFDRLNPGSDLRYVGAIIGLVIGYLTKYQLDKRFVFGDRR